MRSLCRSALKAVATGHNIALDLTDPTMTLFEYFPDPHAFPKVHPSQKGLDDILDIWDPENATDSKFSWIEYDDSMSWSHGATKPNDPAVGHLAFSDSLSAVAGLLANGERTIKLSDRMISLHVVITAAHENTHANQFETYDYVDQDKHKQEIEALPIEMQGPIFNACMEQMSTFEALAYQSEVINLTNFCKMHETYLHANPHEMEQFSELLQSSTNHRDIHFARLNETERTMFVEGDIKALLDYIQREVPEKYIVRHSEN